MLIGGRTKRVQCIAMIGLDLSSEFRFERPGLIYIVPNCSISLAFLRLVYKARTDLGIIHLPREHGGETHGAFRCFEIAWYLAPG